jgi:hypothetical protein
MIHPPHRVEPFEDSEDFGKGKTALSMFMPRIIIAMVKKVPPIPITVMVTPKDKLSMKISFQPRDGTDNMVTSLGNSAYDVRVKMPKVSPAR